MIKICKRLTVILLTIAVSAVNACISVMAEESLCDIVGITESVADKIIKFDGNRYGANPTLVANYQIVPLDDRVGVFSNLSHNDYKIFTTGLRVALVGGSSNEDRNNTTANGYKISITDADRTDSLGGDDVIAGGEWIKAEKNGEETIWIPIVNSYIAQYDSDIGTVAEITLPNEYAAVSHEGGIGGRAFDDNASVFRTTNWPGKARFSFAAPKCVCTYEVSVYAPNEGTAIIYGDTASAQPDKIASFTGGRFGTGYLKYDSSPWSGMKEYDASDWHRIAVTFDPMRGQRWLYVDGELITNSLGWNNPSLYQNVEFGIRDAALEGFVAYDDYTLSYGFYNPNADNIEINANDDIIIRDKALYYNSLNIETTDDFILAMKEISNASDVKLYKDETLSETPEYLNEAKIAVLTSPNGAVRKEMSVAERPFFTADVDFERTGSTICTNANVSNFTDEPITAIMIMVLKDRNGVIKKVISSDEMIIDVQKTITIEFADADDLTAEVFFLNNWENRLALTGNIYTEKQSDGGAY